jgi:hypothetical protein
MGFGDASGGGGEKRYRIRAGLASGIGAGSLNER